MAALHNYGINTMPYIYASIGSSLLILGTFTLITVILESIHVRFTVSIAGLKTKNISWVENNNALQRYDNQKSKINLKFCQKKLHGLNSIMYYKGYK